MEKKSLKQNMGVALAESVAYLMEKLPVHYQLKVEIMVKGKRVSAMKRLCYHVAKAVESVTLTRVFNRKR